jgi:hypothetical protein
MVAHHATFDVQMLETYLKGPPEFLLTALRLPLQRQLSWFRQQNRNAENPVINASSPACVTRNETLLKYFDEQWAPTQFSGSQWFSLQERGLRQSSDVLSHNATAIIEQFDFIFLKERLRESYECLCARTGIRLCSDEYPMEKANVKPQSSCVEMQLLAYRSEALMKGAANDLRLYEIVNDAITMCQLDGISLACRCPEERRR